MKLTALAIPAVLAATAATAIAQPAATAPAPTVTAAVARPEKNDTINLSPLGLLFGDLALTYEHLFPRGHGLIVEAGFGYDSDSTSSESHGSLGVGYRWHWQGKQNSGFLGVMVHEAVGNGEVTLDDGSGEMTYGASVRMTSVTGNIGKRWTIKDAWNVTLRLGAGWGHYSIDIKDAESNADAQEAEDALNAILTLLPVAIDGELSVGYAF